MSLAKGDYDVVRQWGLAAFRQDISQIAPFVRDQVGELKNWNGIKLLTVAP